MSQFLNANKKNILTLEKHLSQAYDELAPLSDSFPQMREYIELLETGKNIVT